MYLKHPSFRGDFGKLTEWVEARAERHFQKQKAAAVSAQHLMRGSGDVEPFALKGDMFSHLMKNLYWYSVSARAITYCGKRGRGRQGKGKGAVCSFYWWELFLGRNSHNTPMSSLRLWRSETSSRPQPVKKKNSRSIFGFFSLISLCSEWGTQSRYTTDLLERASYAFLVEVRNQEDSLFDGFS